jgi:hypothetical protein
MAKYNINNKDIIYKIKVLLDQKIPAGSSEKIEGSIQDTNSLEMMHEDLPEQPKNSRYRNP